MSFALRNASRAAPAVARGARSYATPASLFSVADAAGVKVASSDEGATTGAISVVVKAGSRYESAPGLAHVLKHQVFKGTSKRSAIRLTRETELLGGVLSSSLSREHLILTAEFLKGDEAYFAEVLGDALTQAKFAPHEYNEEVIPAVAAEYEQATRDTVTQAFDLAHGVAFRNGLGNSLFASPHTAVDYSSAVSYAKSAFAPSNIAVLGSGVESGRLQSLVSEFFASSASSSLSAPSSTYFGGETRVAGHGALDTFLLAFKGTSYSEVELSVLRYLLGGESSIKWSAGSSPLSKLASGSSSAKAFNLAYSDAGLFGFVVQAPSAQVSPLATSVVSELKKAAGGVDAEALKQAVAKAKFAAASGLESRVGALEVVGAQVASSGSALSLEQIFSKLDKVTVESVSKAAAELLKSTPTTVAIGNTRILPYADGLGL